MLGYPQSVFRIALLYAVLLVWRLLPLFASAATNADAPAKVQFNRDIRPILSENCFLCHGPDSASRKADLRFDRREVAIKIGAIVPGDVDKSELVKRINSTDPDEMMPPPASHNVLSAKQKSLLTQWIAAGAEYEPMWSFIRRLEAARGVRRPSSKSTGMGQESDRPVRPGEARAERLATGARSGPPHVGPTSLSRSDRPAADG